MATGYIEACQPLSWRQSFDPGPYAWTYSGWRRYGSPSDETESSSSRSGKMEHVALGETEPASLGSDETEPTPKGSGETEPVASRSGETEPAALGSGETF